MEIDFVAHRQDFDRRIRVLSVDGLGSDDEKVAFPCGIGCRRKACSTWARVTLVVVRK
jgi:hypothetical protein